MTRFALLSLFAMATPLSAKVYSDAQVGKSIDARGGENRDLFAVTYPAAIATAASTSGASAIDITITAAAATPITVIAYDFKLNETARVSGTGRVVLRAAMGEASSYLRVVPTGGSYDTPVGTKFQRSVAVRPGDTALLPPYRIALALSGSNATPPVMTLARSNGASPAATALPVAAAAAPMTAATGAVDPRRWGALAAMAGTSWVGGDLVLEFDWLTPNAAMLIRDRGLTGSSEVLVTPAADGKSLAYRRSEPDLREEFTGSAVPSGSRFAWYSDNGGRSLCRVNKGQLTCDSTQGGSSWQRVLSPITRAAGNARIAALPADFPPRPKGWFDPKFGVFADLAAGRWELTHTRQNGVWTKTPGGLALEVGAGKANGGGAIIHIASSLSRKKSMFFKEGQDGKFYTTVSAADHKNPEGRSSVQLVLQPSGRGQYCFYTKYEGTLCDGLTMSRDGKRVLFTEGNAQYILTHTAAPVIKPGNLGLMAKLNGLSFQSSSGEVQSYTISANAAGEAVSAWQSFTRNGESTTFCSTNATLQGMDCSSNRTNRRGDFYTEKYSVALSANPREFNRGGVTFRLDAEGNLVATGSSGTPTIYRRISWGDLRYMEQAKDDNDQIRYAYADRKSRAADKAAFWNGIAQGVANLSNTMADYNRQNAFMAPTNWSARLGGSAASAQAGVPGYNSSMGSIVRVQAPRASLADQYRMDELERFKIREKMYGTGSRGGSAAPAERPYAKAYEQLARDRAATEAASQAARAEQDVADARRQREEAAAADAESARQKAEIDQRAADAAARRKAAADAAAKASAARAAAAKANESPSSSGGLIVTDGRAEDAQRAAEASRIAADNERKAAAERARVAAMVAQQQREEAEAAKRREDARIRALIKCHGSLEAAKKAKATCA